MELLHWSNAIDWSEKEDVALSRYPFVQSSEDLNEQSEPLQNNVILLARATKLPGQQHSLDLETDKMCRWLPYANAEGRKCVDMNEDAIKVFQGLIDDIESLKIVPLPINHDLLNIDDDWLGNRYTKTRGLLRDFGWPEAFRRDEF
jgi:hypothetical protein